MIDSEKKCTSVVEREIADHKKTYDAAETLHVTRLYGMCVNAHTDYRKSLVVWMNQNQKVSVFSKHCVYFP